MAALKLVEFGKLNLDENVNLVLREWKVPENKFTEIISYLSLTSVIRVKQNIRLIIIGQDSIKQAMTFVALIGLLSR